jgi:hypothetical protein
MNEIILEAHDSYNNKDIKIILCDGRENDDVWWLDSWSSSQANGKMPVRIEGGEDPTFNRWSDLKNIKLIVNPCK